MLRKGLVLLTAVSMLAWLGGCDDEDEDAEMRPGEACLSCHGSGSEHGFNAAGTIYQDSAGSAGLDGASIRLYDSNGGLMVELTSNRVGNFYTSNSSVTTPAEVEVECAGGTILQMSSPATSGDCNSCHNGVNTGRIHCP